MRVNETKVFQYAELDDTAKAKARDWYREASIGDNHFAESVLEDAETIAGLLGVDIKQVPVKLMNGKTRNEPAFAWSGFWSQGDGASFEGTYNHKPDCVAAVVAYAPKDEELHAIAKTLQDNGLGFAATIGRHGSRYCHEMAMAIDIEPLADEGQAIAPETEKAITEAFRDFARWIYRQLEEAYEDENSDESVAETIEANEYEFEADGRRARI